MRAICGALAFVMLGAVAHAQTAEPDIVVTGERLHEIVRSFVAEVAAAPAAEDQIARWDRRVCTRLAGLRERDAQFIVDRIAQRAFEVDLEPGGPGCQVNVLVFVTPDSNRFAGEFMSAYRDVLDGNDEPNLITAGGVAMRDFVEIRRPVRWWHVSQTTSEDGQIVRNTQPRYRQGDLTGLSIVRLGGGLVGRTDRVTRQDFNRVVVIVDATLADGVQLDALGDYVAMTVLAQVEPDADTSTYDTILNLFSSGRDGSALAGMTEWDQAYLRALYTSQRNAASSNRQRAAIVRAMEREPSAAPN